MRITSMFARTTLAGRMAPRPAALSLSPRDAALDPTSTSGRLQHGRAFPMKEPHERADQVYECRSTAMEATLVSATTPTTPTTGQGWRDRLRGLEMRELAFIDGDWRPAASGETFECFSPSTGTVVAQVSSCSEADVDRAVVAARSSFEGGDWSRAAPADRKAVLLRLADLMEAHHHELALLETLDMGKPIGEAFATDVPGAIGVFRWFAEAIDKMYDEVAPTGRGDLALVRREPLGVVGAVIPWNFPLDIAAWKCAPALAAGNSVVLKPAEQSPLSSLFLAGLAAEAGLPPGVLNVVPGYGERAGRALGLHNDVDCIAFTGSTETGKRFLRYASDSNMKQVWLECGGKSPNIVFSDAADLDVAADMAAFGIFYNQGEVCSANSRLLVDRSIKDDLLERLVARAERAAPGDPFEPTTAMGAMVDEAHTDRVMSFIQEGKRSARLVTGGERLVVTSSCFIAPTIFDDVTPDHAIAREEIFGPVLSVMAYDSEEQAIAFANDTPYGLAASVWTNDLSRALRVSEQLRAGTVSVNTVDALSPMTPFGGFKQSGVGRDLSLHAFDKFTGLKTTWIKY